MLSRAFATTAGVAAAAALALPSAALADDPTLYRCGEDYNGTPANLSPSFAVLSGPLAVWQTDGGGHLPFVPLDHAHGWTYWNLDVSLPAEHRATLALRAADTRRVALGGHSSPNGLSQGHRKVRFTSCLKRDHRKTSQWPWVIITRARTTCLHLRAKLDGGTTRTVTLPLGRRC